VIWRGSLFWKSVVLFGALVGIASMVTGGSEIYFAYEENKQRLIQLQRESAIATAATIDRFFGDIERQMRWVNASWRSPDARGFNQRHLDTLRLLRQVPAITDIIDLDQAGREQLRISRLSLDVVRSDADRSREPIFSEAQHKGRYFSPVTFRKESEPYVTMALAGSGKRGGVTAADVNLKFIWDAISQVKVANGGRAFVVDGGGQLIADPDLSRVLRRTDLSGLEQVQAALAPAIAGNHSLARDRDGVEVLSAHAVVPSTGWLVFVESPLSEALAPVYASLLRTGGLLAFGLLLSMLACLVLARRITDPIRALQEGAIRVGSGDLDHRIEVRTGDELEALAEQFNDMTARLKEAQAKSERVGMLKRFLSPQLAEVLVSSGEKRILDSHRSEVTVVFCDLRGFTAFSEESEPEEVMGLLGEYHAALGALIHEFEGTLERFVGDGLMVLFNDPLPCPDPAARAVKMALAMRARVEELAQRWRQYGHDIGFGIGIAQGYTTLGQIGFEGRFDYAAIGSIPNLASRLCGEARNGQILISQRVRAEVEEIAELEPVGDLTLKGIHRPIAGFDVRRLKVVSGELERNQAGSGPGGSNPSLAAVT
jgi:class 3 adenylate cyclase